MVSLNAVRQHLPTEKNICCNWIQKHHPIQAGVVMCSGKPLRDPATAGALQGSDASAPLLYGLASLAAAVKNSQPCVP